MLAPDLKVIDRLKSIKWLSECSHENSRPKNDNIIWVGNWDDAVRYCSDWQWRNTTLEASNALSLFLHNRHRNEYCEWNKIAKQARTFIDGEVRSAVEAFVAEKALSRRVVDSVSWAVGHMLIEAAYFKFRPPLFFTTVLLPIYEAGHFPCGWEGAWPEGKLIAL